MTRQKMLDGGRHMDQESPKNDKPNNEYESKFSFEHPHFSNFLEVLPTPRPDVSEDGLDVGNLTDRSDVDDAGYYNSINGKLGIFAELS